MGKDSTYHRILRISAAVGALVLLFESGLISHSTAVLSQNTHRYLANAVGMNAAVAPNEFNVITAELTAQKYALDQREAALRDREIAVNFSSDDSNERNTYIIASLLFIILVLILLNYVLDYLRARELRSVGLNTTV
jgi:hypothetical protein